MSQSLGSRPHHGAHSGRPQKGHAHAQHTTTQHAREPKSGDFTFGLFGRQFRVRALAFWPIVATLVVMAGWSLVTATYFAFRDDLLTRLIARQTSMQYAYEDRIADLRAQVDRLTSRQLLDQEQFEQKLDHLVKRQNTLESRASALAGVAADPTPTGSIKLAPRTSENNTAPAAKPSPINDTLTPARALDQESRLESWIAPQARVAAVKTLDGTLAHLQSSLDRVEARQAAALNRIEQGFDVRAHKMRGVFTDLGLDLGKTQSTPTATGGPFVPVSPRADASAFDRQLYRVSLAKAQVDRLSRSLVRVPFRRPLEGEIDLSSGFGVRLDPFLRSPAMHTGLDFRGNTGDLVRATAAGTVSQTGWFGGYGKMVEIDHGNGLATRYGHLSAIDVQEGQTVRIGQILGRVGTTGRSTGPHLHYETRIDGDAVDPQKFLRAGNRYGGV